MRPEKRRRAAPRPGPTLLIVEFSTHTYHGDRRTHHRQERQTIMSDNWNAVEEKTAGCAGFSKQKNDAGPARLWPALRTCDVAKLPAQRSQCAPLPLRHHVPTQHAEEFCY